MNFKSTARRKDRLLKDERKDAYVDQASVRESSVCSKCNAVYTSGRWTWKTSDQTTTKTTCPAWLCAIRSA